MLLLRRTEWKLVDIVDNLLKFQNLRHKNEFYLAKAAKLLDTVVNESVVYDLDRMTSDQIEALLNDLRNETLQWVTVPKDK